LLIFDRWQGADGEPCAECVIAKEPHMKALDITSAILVIVGALNWGLVGLARFNLVAAILGDGVLAAIVYTLVGIAGTYQLGRMLALPKPAVARA
jgi:uncharacterized membrane protein YuzA (DUF378 family)